MKRRLRRTRTMLGVFAVAVVGFAVAGCAQTATGGGYILSTNGVDKATFAFSYDVSRAVVNGDPCNIDYTRARVHGTYHDYGAGVAFKVNQLEDLYCSPLYPNGIDIYATYESQDPANPGTGTVEIALTDNGEPNRGADDLSVTVFDGPFIGYSDSGPVQGGNLQTRNPVGG